MLKICTSSFFSHDRSGAANNADYLRLNGVRLSLYVEAGHKSPAQNISKKNMSKDCAAPAWNRCAARWAMPERRYLRSPVSDHKNFILY